MRLALIHMPVELLDLGVFTVTLVLWLAHAWWSWSRPSRTDPFGWLLLAGLPVVAVVTLVAFGSAPAPPEGTSAPLPRGDHGDLRLRLLILTAELVVAWLLVLFLEAVLVAVRESRRGHLRNSAAERPADNS